MRRAGYSSASEPTQLRTFDKRSWLGSAADVHAVGVGVARASTGNTRLSYQTGAQSPKEDVRT